MLSCFWFLLSIGCLATLARKRYALLASMPIGAIILFLIVRSARLVDLRSDLLINGTSSGTNNELARIAQIFGPLSQFPFVYKPPLIFGGIVLEPMGLLPLVAGYGSVLGIVWLLYILRRNFSLRRIPLRPLALIAGAVLLILTAPDFIPAVVAFAFFMVPRGREGKSPGPELSGEVAEFPGADAEAIPEPPHPEPIRSSQCDHEQ